MSINYIIFNSSYHDNYSLNKNDKEMIEEFSIRFDLQNSFKYFRLNTFPHDCYSLYL